MQRLPYLLPALDRLRPLRRGEFGNMVMQVPAARPLQAPPAVEHTEEQRRA